MLIEIYGTPKEIVVGEINEEQYEFWKEREHDLLYGAEGEFLSFQEYCLGKYNEYQVKQNYDFILDDWSDVNDVYTNIGFFQNENLNEIEVKFTQVDSENSLTISYTEPKIETFVEIDEPDVGSFHFIGQEIYEKQLCFSATVNEEDLNESIVKELSFQQDIIYDQKIITEVSFRNVSLSNKAKINSSVIEQKFYLKP